MRSSAVYNRGRELCAAFGLLALRDSFMDLFIDGRIEDLKLRDNDILTGSNAKKCERLYISGVVVRDPGKLVGHRRTKVMLWAMLQHLKREYGLRKIRELYAIAVTRESERLMRNLQFEHIGESSGRLDKCPLYRCVLTRANWKRLLCEVGDCSGMCSIRCS